MSDHSLPEGLQDALAEDLGNLAEVLANAQEHLGNLQTATLAQVRSGLSAQLQVLTMTQRYVEGLLGHLEAFEDGEAWLDRQLEGLNP